MAMAGLKERAKTLCELWESAQYIFATRPLEPDAKAQKHLGPEGRQVLAGIQGVLADVPEW
jgi:glutamyl-tRNA synthetase